MNTIEWFALIIGVVGLAWAIRTEVKRRRAHKALLDRIRR
jgi:hypothetical protein